MADKVEALKRMLRDVLAPLVEADGGELYLVSVGKKEVKLHLGGTLNGSPASGQVANRVVEPAVKAIQPKAKLVVTSGWSIPDGAERISSAEIVNGPPTEAPGKEGGGERAESKNGKKKK